MVHGALGKHGQIFDLGLPQGWAVVRDEHHLRARIPHAFDGGLVAKGSLAGLHHQLEPGVHGLDGLLLLEIEQLAREDKIDESMGSA